MSKVAIYSVMGEKDLENLLKDGAKKELVQ